MWIPLWAVSELLMFLGVVIGLVKAKLMIAWNDSIVYPNQPEKHIREETKQTTKEYWDMIIPYLCELI